MLLSVVFLNIFLFLKQCIILKTGKLKASLATIDGCHEISPFVLFMALLFFHFFIHMYII